MIEIGLAIKSAVTAHFSAVRRASGDFLNALKFKSFGGEKPPRSHARGNPLLSDGVTSIN